jgi:integrase
MQSVVHRTRQSQSRKALTPEEIQKVLRVASESKRNLAMILLAYRHGMRASEVCELRLADLDLKNGQITIRRLKGSLTTTQPLSDHPGQPLLSEKRVRASRYREAGPRPQEHCLDRHLRRPHG